MRCLTGSQSKFRYIGVTWQNLDTDYTKWALTFWKKQKHWKTQNKICIMKWVLLSEDKSTVT